MPASQRIEAQRDVVRGLVPGTRVRVLQDPRLVNEVTLHLFEGRVGTVATPGHRERGGIVVPEPDLLAYVDFGGDLGIRILHPLALVLES